MDPCKCGDDKYKCRPTTDPYGGWPPSPAKEYALRGPQVEPAASYWLLCPAPCVVPIQEITAIADDPKNPCYFQPYPDEKETQKEIAELKELACLRDDPEAIFSDRPGRERKGLSLFLRLRPQPFGAVINTLRRGDALLINGSPELRRSAIDVCAQPRPDMGPIPCATDCVDDFYPAIRTGRELARYFESETPGLAHRLALNYLLRDANFSAPYQAFIWAALDVAIYSALGAAWYYKWIADANCELHEPCRMSRHRRDRRTSRRPRPYEVDYEVDVLFNRAVNCTGSGDGERRLLPDPSPGTPRHPSYPSGHSTYAGAASEILSYFFPDYSGELTKLADNTGLARLWAGIHYRSDHIEGMKLGRCVARLIIHQIEKSCIVRPDPCASAGSSVADCMKRPPTREDLCTCAHGFCHCCSKAHGHESAEAQQESSGEQGGRDEAQGGGAEASSGDVRAQARGPQEGAGIAGSTQEQRDQAQGPQEGAGSAGSSERAKEQAKGPQEGAQ
jgi:membrane-associated phospholipid phosphatase